ncbi:MAG: hypothetical protein RL758_1795, partial [Pseudomonadota bacterium]|jgi:hypothetical protein
LQGLRQADGLESGTLVALADWVIGRAH